MVGPASDEERRATTRVVAAGFVGLVGVSSGLMAFWGGATPGEVGVVTAVGLAVGGALVLFFGSSFGR